MKSFYFILIALVAFSCQPKEADKVSTAKTDPLPSWNDTENKEAIINFVTEATKEGGENYIPVADRIAAFDNDGTLWCEQPLYIEMVYSLATAKQMIADKPELAKNPKLKALTDKATFEKNPELGIETAFVLTHAGISDTDFGYQVDMWADSARHPRFQKRYPQLIYRPMVDLLQYLRDNQFKTYIVSGGSSAFIRKFSDGLYGIPAEQVIGTMLKGEFQASDNTYKVIYTADLWHNDDKEGKPVAIQQIIGKKPVLAFGNSDGDKQMLEWTSTNKLPNLSLILQHTDAEREYAYDSLSHIGTLKEALKEGIAKGWLIVDMKQDFKVVFDFQQEQK